MILTHKVYQTHRRRKWALGKGWRQILAQHHSRVLGVWEPARNKINVNCLILKCQIIWSHEEHVLFKNSRRELRDDTHFPLLPTNRTLHLCISPYKKQRVRLCIGEGVTVSKTLPVGGRQVSGQKWTRDSIAHVPERHEG